MLTGEFNSLLASGAINSTAPYNSFVNAGRHNLYRATDTLNYSPRFGFAWSPGGRENTVLRGGFGIFYDTFPAVVGDNFMTNLPGVVTVYNNPVGNASGVPWADTTTAASPYIQGANASSAIMSGFANGASYSSLLAALGPTFRTPNFVNQAGTFHTPYYEEWSLQLQQAIGTKSQFSLGYVGNHGVHIPVDNPGLNAFGAGFAPFPATPPTGCSDPPAPARPSSARCREVQLGRYLQLQRPDG